MVLGARQPGQLEPWPSDLDLGLSDEVRSQVATATQDLQAGTGPVPI